ncbi:Hypothetical_protein [Hexamita inflata]|uniref:Hypothetical_protein n=1 Tax=Hexamita inflata TaxID=28002 RepID=A0AA86P4G5_9EUKA|nr:Hypothetical protein HINF_LOCUS19429 [Hexamita inflata]
MGQHLHAPDQIIEYCGHSQVFLAVLFVASVAQIHVLFNESGNAFTVLHWHIPLSNSEPVGQVQTFEVLVELTPQTQTPLTGKAFVVEHLQTPLTKVEPVGQTQEVLVLVAFTPQTQAQSFMKALVVQQEQLLKFEFGREPIAQQQSPLWRTEPVMHGQVPVYEAGSLIIWELTKPTKVRFKVETVPEPEVNWTKPQFKVEPEVTREQVMFQIEHAPLFSQMKPQVFAPERAPDTVRFLKVEDPSTKETKPQLIDAEVVIEKLEFWIIKLFTQLEIPQNLEIIVEQMKVKVLLLITSFSVRLFAIPQKLEIQLLVSNQKLEPLISTEYSGIVATRNANSQQLEFDSFMLISVSTIVKLVKIQWNKLNGYAFKSNSASILTEKTLWFTCQNRTLSIRVHKFRVLQLSNVNYSVKTSCVFCQKGLQNTKLQQNSNSAIEKTRQVKI